MYSYICTIRVPLLTQKRENMEAERNKAAIQVDEIDIKDFTKKELIYIIKHKQAIIKQELEEMKTYLNILNNKIN